MPIYNPINMSKIQYTMTQYIIKRVKSKKNKKSVETRWSRVLSNSGNF